MKKRKRHDRGAYLRATLLESGFGRTIIDLIPKKASLIVAFSGGPDSTALLYLLNKYSDLHGYKITACHFNHKLRGKRSDSDESFCRSFCSDNNIVFRSDRADVKKIAADTGWGTERAARESRYAFFVKEAKKRKASYIVLGHNMDDAAETYLMRVIKGAGLTALSGIRESRAIGDDEFNGIAKHSDIRLVRPLINRSKKDILNFLDIKALHFAVDESNNSDEFDRNRIRHKLIPFVEKNFNPAFKRACANQAAMLSADADYLDNAAGSFCEENVKHKEGVYRVSSQKLLGVHSAIRGRVIRYILENVMGKRSSDHTAVMLVEEVLRSGREKGLAKALAAGISGKELVIPFKASEAAPLSVNFMPNGRKFRFGNMGFLAKTAIKTKMPVFDDPNTAFFDADKLKLPLTVRTRLNGDRFMPYGMKNMIKIKDFIISQKAGKMGLPIITDSEKIIWVAGLRTDERVKVTENTRKMLIIKAFF